MQSIFIVLSACLLILVAPARAGVGKILFVLRWVPMSSKPSQGDMPLRHLQRTI
jgi:hypothetical protein